MVLRILLGVLQILYTRLSLSLAGLPRPFYYLSTTISQSLPRSARTLVWALPRSLAATYGIDVSFSSSPYLDVSVQEVPDIYLCIQYMTTEVCSARFPHSEICGSQDICSLPQLIAAYHVFLRLSVPRHPPCALSNLTFQHIVASYVVVFVITYIPAFITLNCFRYLSLSFLVLDVLLIINGYQ